MKKLLLLIMALLTPIFLMGQEEELDIPFDNEPLNETSRSYFVLAGGLTYDWLMLTDRDLIYFYGREQYSDISFSGPMQLIGGQGVVSIPWAENLRIGVLGYGGSIESGISTINDYNSGDYPNFREIDVQISLIASMFGLSMHYGYVPYEKFAILGGFNTGWGNVIHELYSTFVNKDVENNFGYGMGRFEKNYFFVMPSLQFEYALTNFLVLRADASYNLIFGQDEKWTFNYLTKRSNIPNFNLSSMKLGLGVMVGLANF